MAAGILINPGWTPAVDSDGAPIPDARAYYYVDETTTLASIYADEGLSTPLPNPLEANSSGRWPIVWADDSETYTVTVSAPYGPAGVPFTVTGLQASQATDILVMESVTAAADQADAAAAASVGAYEDILALAASLPDTDPIVIAGKADVDGGNIISAPDQLAFREAIGADLAQNVANTLPLASNTTQQAVATYINNGVIQPSMFAGTTQQQITRAITEATATRNNAQGQTVQIPRGEMTVTASFNLDNRVTLAGVNKRGSILKADAAHVGPYMVTVANGTSSMFDNRIERLTLNANNVAGLGGVDSRAWQEGGGLRDALVLNFRTYGVSLTEMQGGAALTRISDTEIFGSSSGCTAGVFMNDASSVSAFQIIIEGTTVAGGGVSAANMPRAIHIQNGSSLIKGSHVEVCQAGIYLDGNGDHVIEGFTGSDATGGVTNLVEIASTFTGTLEMRACRRNGATNLLKDNRSGGLGTITGYDTDVSIKREPPLAIGQAVAGGSFDGTNLPGSAVGFGFSSVSRNSAGNYDISLSRSGPNAATWAHFASSNFPGGTVQCNLATGGFVNIIARDAAGAAADANEVKFVVFRVK